MNFTRALWLTFFGTLPLAGQIPVNCHDVLTIPGGSYVLTGNITGCSSPVVKIAADNVSFNLQGFTITASTPGTAIETSDGTACVTTTGVSVYGGTVTGFDIGINICVPTGPGHGPQSTNANIHHMTVTGNSTGITLFSANDNNIHHNTVTGNTGISGINRGYGIVLFGSSGNQIKQNEVNGNGNPLFAPTAGIALLSGSSDNTLMQNAAKGNAEYGIYVQLGSRDNVIKKNDATGNGTIDLKDGSGACTANDWKSNSFGTSDPACIQ